MCVSCMCVSESVFSFGFSGLILFVDSLSEENKTEYLSLISFAQTPYSLSLPPTRALKWTSCPVFGSSSQTTTIEKLTWSIVLRISVFHLLVFLASALCLFLPVLPSFLEVNVLSCYTVCLSYSQTVTLDKWTGSISTSWRTRGTQLHTTHPSAAFRALC